MTRSDVSYPNPRTYAPTRVYNCEVALHVSEEADFSVLLAAADRRFLVLRVDLDKTLVLVLGFDPAGHLRAVEVVLCVGIGKVVGRVAWGDVAFCCCCFFGFFGFLEGGKEWIWKYYLFLYSLDIFKVT
jgi:hypothetical protein